MDGKRGHMQTKTKTGRGESIVISFYVVPTVRFRRKKNEKTKKKSEKSVWRAMKKKEEERAMKEGKNVKKNRKGENGEKK